MILVHVRHAWRTFRAHALTSTLAVLILGLGIGLAAVTYSNFSGNVLRGLPIEGVDRVKMLSAYNEAGTLWHAPIFTHDFVDFQEAQKSFSSLGGVWLNKNVNLSEDEGYPELHPAGLVTHEIFDILGKAPIKGRPFLAEDMEEGAPLVTVITTELWRSRFQRDENILQRPIRIDGQPAQIVGIMPEGFLFPFHQYLLLPRKIDLSTPRGSDMFFVMGRLKEGVSEEAAQQEMITLAQRLGENFPETHANRSVWVEPYHRFYIGPRPLRSFWGMVGAAALMLAIGCVGVAALLTARGTTRVQEFAIRVAVGAERRHIFSQVLTESFLLAALGTILSTGVAWVGILYFQSLWAPNPYLPFWMQARLTPGVFAAMGVCAFVTALLAGFYPAWRAARPDLATILKDEGRAVASQRTKQMSRVLIVANVALGWALLVATALLASSLLSIRSVDLGVPSDDVFTGKLMIPQDKYPEPAERVALIERLIENLERRSEVVSATVSTNLPATGADETVFSFEGRQYATANDYPWTFKATVTPEYFETFPLEAVEGRVITREDRADTEPIVVVSESFVKRFLSGEKVLGQRVRLGNDDSGPWREIVGVVPDYWIWEMPRDHRRDGFYIPFAQRPDTDLYLAVHMQGQPASFAELMRDELYKVDPEMPLNLLMSMTDLIILSRVEIEFFGSFYVAVGAVAMLLVALGIYGVVSFTTGRRTAEVGLRMALGAKPGNVVGMILSESGASLVVGLILGFGLAWYGPLLLDRGLYGVRPQEPIILIATAIFLIAVAILASWLPARRAAALEPGKALRF